MNNRLVAHLIESAYQAGVREFCLAAGKRNAPFVYALSYCPDLKTYSWPEERSAAFFALGRARATGRPVGVVTTSGTAAGQLLPAAMEAYYTQDPLLLITADRPRRLRGSGAPQCAEQVGLFGYYASYMQDLAENEICQLHYWSQKGPAHLNVCFEDPEESDCLDIAFAPPRLIESTQVNKTTLHKADTAYANRFLSDVKFPLVVIGALLPIQRESIISFLLRYQAPIYAEAQSGLREDPRLAHLRISGENPLKRAYDSHYSIDGVLRIGSIPTLRLWRDLDELGGKIQVLSVCDLPFSGLSWSEDVMPLNAFNELTSKTEFKIKNTSTPWLESEEAWCKKLYKLLEEEPLSEPALVYQLSKQLKTGSHIYIGNSMPIRHWDLVASHEFKGIQVTASRGLCGIDGQISTFLGLCQPHQENWALIGDLTALYDMVAPWILEQLVEVHPNLAIINNSGGQIFSHLFSHPGFINRHQLNFKPLADFWKWNYERWETIPSSISPTKGGRLIEIVPDAEATQRFYKKKQSL